MLAPFLVIGARFGERLEEVADMLILTRRIGETVMIGEDITVTVLGVKGNQVRIGVSAPRNVAVHREEIFERIKREEAGDAGVDGETSDADRDTFAGAIGRP